MSKHYDLVIIGSGTAAQVASGRMRAAGWSVAVIDHLPLGGTCALRIMVKVALLVRLEAKPGKESAVAKFLESALPLANEETTTPVWFALRLGPSAFGIFDAFADEAGRKAHLAGPIAAALMANASELLAKAPQIEQVDLLAVKLAK